MKKIEIKDQKQLKIKPNGKDAASASLPLLIPR